MRRKDGPSSPRPPSSQWVRRLQRRNPHRRQPFISRLCSGVLASLTTAAVTYALPPLSTATAWLGLAFRPARLSLEGPATAQRARCSLKARAGWPPQRPVATPLVPACTAVRTFGLLKSVVARHNSLSSTSFRPARLEHSPTALACALTPALDAAIGPWLRSTKLHALRQAAPMPVSELLQQLHAVKALAVDVAFANKELCPKLREVLGANEELRQTFTRDFCWDASQQAFSSQHAATIDLSKLVASLQKYLYERLPGQVGAPFMSSGSRCGCMESEVLALHADATGRGFSRRQLPMARCTTVVSSTGNVPCSSPCSWGPAPTLSCTRRAIARPRTCWPSRSSSRALMAGLQTQ